MLSVILLLLLVYSLLEPFWISEKTIRFVHQDIPLSFSGTRILFLTDIHHGPFFSRERVAALVDRVNALHPDLILLGGDYVHRDPKYIEPCFAELARLQAPLGVFGVLGNHDHWESAEHTRTAMKKTGIVNLDNNAVWLSGGNEKIRLGGVGDVFEDIQDTGPTLASVADSTFVILLSHNPDAAETFSSKIDLVFSGHTHGGQVSFFGLWAPLVPSIYGQKYRSGIVQNGKTTVILSNGIGTITPPVRFFARPEIVIVELERRS